MTKRARIAPRKKPRQTRAAVTVGAILDAAARILVQGGVERANVNHIAALAGVSVGSLYQYFPSKEVVVLAVAKRHNERMIEVFRRDIGDIAMLPVPEAVRALVRRALEAYSVDPALRRVILTDDPRMDVLSRSQEFDEMLRELLTAYVTFHATHFRPANVPLAVKIAITAVEAVLSTLVSEGAAPAAHDELADELTALLLGYLAKPVSP